MTNEQLKAILFALLSNKMVGRAYTKTEIANLSEAVDQITDIYITEANG